MLKDEVDKKGTMIDDREVIISDVCDFCKNIIKFRKCKAFRRIPLEIWSGQNKHTERFEGDNGILFEPIEIED